MRYWIRLTIQRAGPQRLGLFVSPARRTKRWEGVGGWEECAGILRGGRVAKKRYSWFQG